MGRIVGFDLVALYTFICICVQENQKTIHMTSSKAGLTPNTAGDCSHKAV